MSNTFKCLLAALCLAAIALPVAARREMPRVVVNPGHGGHDSDDRNGPFMQFLPGDTAGFWESNSNLAKGNALTRMLRAKGYDVLTTRVTNTSDDDLDLYEISSLANNAGADAFVAIHSNATGVPKRVNYTAQLYKGNTGEPANEASLQLADCISQQLAANEATVWTSRRIVAGDWSFFGDWGWKRGLGVLRYNKVPAMLSEGTFHDYEPERARLLNAGYCGLEAWNMSVALDHYFSFKPKAKSGMVAGIVRDANALRPDTCQLFPGDQHEPLNGVTVQLLNSRGVTVASCVTDTLHNGFYSFEGVPAGRYTLRTTRHDTGATVTKPVTVNRDGSTYCNVEL